MLYLIGIGLWDEKDISVKGLELVKKCDTVYLETYTSCLNISIDTLQRYYDRKVLPADRKLVENGNQIIQQAQKTDVALLIIGDVFAATTHVDHMLRCRQKGIPVQVIHNASVLTAVGETGLELYKFGKVTSIPFDNKNVVSPITAYKSNKKAGLHTLFLLDLDPQKDKYMRIKEAVEYLLRNKIPGKTLAVGCAGLGSSKPEIKAAQLSILRTVQFTLLPQCLIIPGKLHFMEEDALKQYKV